MVAQVSAKNAETAGKEAVSEQMRQLARSCSSEGGQKSRGASCRLSTKQMKTQKKADRYDERRWRQKAIERASNGMARRL